MIFLFVNSRTKGLGRLLIEKVCKRDLVTQSWDRIVVAVNNDYWTAGPLYFLGTWGTWGWYWGKD